MFSAAALAPLDLVCSDKWNICVSYVFKFLLLHCDTVTLWHCDTVPGYTKFTAKSRRTRLQKETFSLSLPDRLRSQHSSNCLIKHLRGERESWLWWLLRRGQPHLFKASLSESRALEVLDRSYFVCQFLSLLSLNGRVPVVRQSLQSLLVFPQIYFGSWKQQNIFLLRKYFYRLSSYLSIKWGHRGNDVWSQDTILR